MNADDLRAVAAEIREKAQPMLKGTPWRDDRGCVATNKGFIITGHSGMLVSAHIAAWHPGVALTVATWLEAEAAHMHECRPLVQASDAALAFVKAWRGELS